ncbi:hypothetical protein ACICHK_22365 [Streptomyces sp. AHU1]|uniref:hypothetical protein n=1 Tax=Streptomyces sp. AHU1 TaxID=3377215 RepID=UPI003877DFA6
MATEDIMITGAADEMSSTAQALRTYPLAPGHNVNVRSGPGTHFSVVRTLPAGSRVSIYCQCPGESVAGPYGTSNIWDNIANGQFVADAYVQTGSDGYVTAKCS